MITYTDHTSDFKTERARSASSDQNCTTRSSIATLLGFILKSPNICQAMRFFVFDFPVMWLVILKKNFKIWLVVLFYCPILIGCEKDAI